MTETPPPRRIEYMPLTALAPARRNAKMHDLTAVHASIERLGYADAAIVDERTGLLLGGHGRTDVLMLMHGRGEDPPDGVTVDDTGQWMVPVQRGWASRNDREAEALLIALNRLPAIGGWDSRALTEMLEELFEDTPDVAALTGYSPDDLDRLLTEIAADNAAAGPATEPDAPAEFPSFDEDIETQWTCPRCQFSWSGKTT